jgi:hypothetical protein
MILNYNQEFLFCGQKLSGLSDLTFSSDFGLESFSSLGARQFGFGKAKPSVGQVEFSRSLIYNDPVLGYTGNSPCSGVFSYGEISNGFESGYLGGYSVSCSVGQVPSVSATVSVYGEMKSGVASQSEVSHPDVFIPSPKSITVTSDYSSTNRVKSFQWRVECPRRPRYSIGTNLFPDSVEQLFPLRISANIEYDVRGFSFLDLQNFARTVSAPSFSVTIKNRELSQTIMSFPIENAQIVNQQIQGTVDSPLSLGLSYEGYLE